MTEIGFYHLTRTPMEQALPRLLGRVLASGGRAFVLCGEPERAKALDASLWLGNDPDWLPHGLAGGEHDTLQPILIGTQDTPPANDARFLVLVAGATSTRLSDYDRILDLFDGSDPNAVTAARTRWTTAKSAGHTLTYWQQGPTGWDRKG